MIMAGARTRWILGFDGSCGSCAGVADAVAAACGDRLEVLPLQHPDVADRRRRVLGDGAAWRPVLLRVSGDTDVQGWTGIRMAGRLVAHLGLRTAGRVVRTLGRLGAMNDRGEIRRPGDLRPLQRLSRAHRARDVGRGLVTLAGMAVTGKAPASTDTVGGWERVLEGSLPTTLPDLSLLPEIYRWVAYRHLTPEQRSAAWTAHLDTFAAEVDASAPAGRSAFARARAVAADPQQFREPDLPLLDSVSAEVVAAFGRDRARAMLAILGPEEPDDPELPAVSCGCSVSSDYCSGGRRCRLGLQGCVRSSSGCGTFYSYPCDGLCA